MAIEPGDQFDDIIQSNYAPGEADKIESQAKIENFRSQSDPGEHILSALDNTKTFLIDGRDHFFDENGKIKSSQHFKELETAMPIMERHMGPINMHMKAAIQHHNEDNPAQAYINLGLAARMARNLHLELSGKLGESHPVAIAASFHADAAEHHADSYLNHFRGKNGN
jgi:hypothetical protein